MPLLMSPKEEEKANRYDVDGRGPLLTGGALSF